MRKYNRHHGFTNKELAKLLKEARKARPKLPPYRTHTPLTESVKAEDDRYIACPAMTNEGTPCRAKILPKNPVCGKHGPIPGYTTDRKPTAKQCAKCMHPKKGTGDLCQVCERYGSRDAAGAVQRAQKAKQAREKYAAKKKQEREAA